MQILGCRTGNATMNPDLASIEADIRTGIRAANWVFNIGEKSEISLEEVLLKWTLLAHEYTDDFLKAFHTVIERDFPNLALRPAKAALCASFLLARVVFDSEKALDELERFTGIEDDCSHCALIFEGLVLALDALHYAKLREMFKEKLENLYREIYRRVSFTAFSEGLKSFIMSSSLVTNRMDELIIEMALIPEVSDGVRKVFEEIPYNEDTALSVDSLSAIVYDKPYFGFCSFIATVRRTDILSHFFLPALFRIFHRIPRQEECKILLKGYLEASSKPDELIEVLKERLNFSQMNIHGHIFEKGYFRKILLAVRSILGSKSMKEVLTGMLNADNFEDALRKLAADYPGLLFSWEVEKLRKNGVYFDSEAVI